MVSGFITTKHILRHPVTLIKAVGVRGYIHMIRSCLDKKPHCFLEMMFHEQDDISINTNSCHTTPMGRTHNVDTIKESGLFGYRGYGII